MELNVQLQVRAEEVFEQLLRSILQDIKQSTGQTIPKEQLAKDFSYQKNIKNRMGYDTPVKVQIDELIPSKEYRASIEHSKGINTMAYTLTDTEKGVEIHYKERYQTSSTLQNWNYSIASIFFARKSKKNMKKQFAYLEEIILNENKSCQKEVI
ncbi:DUF3284 domain-containing protein [Gottfriedia sp. NPDC057991]|uniref:DUF3284 domain-containing protein n=1 Tax=Gottfriedia sp. NPDC057991 TaxID=3346298 RepID=UPI0036DE4D7B